MNNQILHEAEAIVQQYQNSSPASAEVTGKEPLTPVPPQGKGQPISKEGLPVDPQALKPIPESIARKYLAIPLEIRDGTLVVAMASPDNLQAIEDLEAHAHMRIQPVEARAEDIQRAIDLHYQARQVIEKELSQVPLTQRQAPPPPPMTAQTPIARVVDLVMSEAIRNRVSDIHIEPQEGKVRIRYRIDGVLREVMSLPMDVHNAVVSRVKILSGMNIAESRRPQDGQLSFQVDGRNVDVRVATGITVHGELLVLRLLDKGQSPLSLSKIGMSPEDLQRYDKMIKNPFGLVVIAGPTGSGKTTTLYASINELNQGQTHIITIEDPVEYRFENIDQIQVNPKAGLTFASGLKGMMRLDPDVIVVGEVRDAETAQIAIQASLTGHLVLCSLHANDAAGVPFRLMDLGIEPALLSTALLGVVSQRMVRRLCPKCAIPTTPSPQETAGDGAEAVVKQATAVYEGRHLKGMLAAATRWLKKNYRGMESSGPVPLTQGPGCSYCSNTGYRGRTGVFEIMVLSDALRHLICTPSTTSVQLRAQAIQEGMITMKQAGMAKVQAGITTASEVLATVLSTAPTD